MPKIMYMDENYSGSSYGNLEEYSEDLLYSPSTPPTIVNRWDTPLHTGISKSVLEEYQLLECGIGGSTTTPGTQVINVSAIPESISSVGDKILAINLVAEDNANTHCAYLTIYDSELLIMCSTGVNIPVWYIKGIKVGNSNIIPNPVEQSTKNLVKLQFGNEIYRISNQVPIVYSETEQEIGVWTDGKPLYQKTWVESINANSRVQLLTNIENETTIGLAYYDGTNWIDPFYTDNTTNIGGGFTQLVSNVLYFMNNMASNLTWRFTIRYTKTTDIAGSGRYAELGEPAIHYDISERVIGTYFGKPLYRKGFEFSSLTFSDQSITLQNDLSNVLEITNYGGSFYDPNENRYTPIPYERKTYSEHVLFQTVVFNNTHTVALGLYTNMNDYATIQNVKVWVEYTKTTD